MIAAEPGDGKTGSLVSLAEAGFNVRLLDYDGNLEPLMAYGSPEALARIDAVTLQDKLADVGEVNKYLASEQIPTAFTRGYKLLTKGWKYTEGDTTVDLGKASEWGPETVVVLDSLSAMGEAAMRRAMAGHNKTPFNMTSQVWGHAAKDQTDFVKMMAFHKNRFHVIVLAHKRTLSAADIITQNDDAKGNEKIKEVKIEMLELLPPAKEYPVAITKNLSRAIAKELPTLLTIERKFRNGHERRYIRTESVAEWGVGVKISGKGLKDAYPIETGLADLFADLGIKAPGK
jgi:hypothetical protein